MSNGDNGYPRDIQQQVTLLIERQRNMMKRRGGDREEAATRCRR